jgi:thiol:disulfide interchange protein DsbA
MLRLVSALLFGLILAPVASAQGLVERYQAGVHYFMVEPAQPTRSDTIEVTEVFSYACHACLAFQPAVDAWKPRMPAGASFAYMPATWHPTWELVGRGYYAAEALGIVDKTHQKLFNALHVEKKPIATLEDLAKWYAETAGIKAEDFLAAARSSGVNIKVARTKQVVPAFGVESTPTLIVAGKYRVTGRTAGSWEEMLAIADFLIGKESAARKPAG